MRIWGILKTAYTKLYKTINAVISDNKTACRFLLLFGLFSLCFFTFFFVIQSNLDFLLFWTADATGYISNLIGLHVLINGTVLSLGTMDLEIIPECTGIFAIMIIAASILAYPTEIKKKAIGILFVVPLILFLNVARLLFLVYIGKYHVDLFDFAHSFFWQGSFIIFIIFAWFLWIEFVVNR